MKVLDLRCGYGHGFEGWFASESEFLSQLDQAMVQCPVCGDSKVVKEPSAPRLNLSPSRVESSEMRQTAGVADSDSRTLAWLAAARHIVAHTTDVGDQFAQEARRMHYREVNERGIRGTTTVDEAHALLDEGIAVLPFVMPEGLKEPLQ